LFVHFLFLSLWARYKTMFIQTIHKKTKNKTYTSVVLMENYRENGKVKHRIISNLSKWPPELVEGLRKLLKGNQITTIEDLDLTQGKSIGGILVIYEVAKRLGIIKALGSSRNGLLTLVQVAGRILSPGSRFYLANEWQQLQAIKSVFKIEKFTHHELYQSLKWASKHQDKLEKNIFLFRHKDKPVKQVFLYDVTSSYLEGEQNELAAYGYNRDKKQGKKQIVIGLLTDDEGYPVSVEVFKGNTNDLQTVSSQLKKLKENFGVEKVVFVGDKGMIKTSQIKEITSTDYKWHYLTSITKQQIRTLVKQEVIQLELFTDELVEVEFEGVRYILRRNPYRAEAIGKNREERINVIQDFVEQQNRYLASHERAREEVALRRVKEKIEKLGLENIFKARIENRRIQLELDEIKLKEQEELDGCYVIKTDVPKEELDTVKAHDRYKDLAKVEMAFRVMKTTLEEIRPVYVRKEETTRGHVFIVMLAYMIIKYITDRLAKLGYSKKFIFESLDKIHELYYTYEGKQIRVLPKKLLKPQEAILKELNIKLK